VWEFYGIHLAADTEQANQALGAFIDTYQDHPLLEFEKLTETLLEWGDEIFAFHDADRITNGRIEGTNNKLGVLKRAAYGFVNVTNFAARALLLTPGCQHHHEPRIEGSTQLNARNQLHRDRRRRHRHVPGLLIERNRSVSCDSRGIDTPIGEISPQARGP
jgi:hypothetical protein